MTEPGKETSGWVGKTGHGRREMGALERQWHIIDRHRFCSVDSSGAGPSQRRRTTSLKDERERERERRRARWRKLRRALVVGRNRCKSIPQSRLKKEDDRRAKTRGGLEIARMKGQETETNESFFQLHFGPSSTPSFVFLRFHFQL